MAYTKWNVENPDGLKFMPKSGNVNVRSQPYTTKSVIYSLKSNTYIPSTGFLYKVDGDDDTHTWYEVTTPDGTTGYVRKDVVTPTIVTADQEAQQLINQLIESDKKVHANLLDCSVLIYNAKQKGIDTSKHDAKLATLLERFKARQDVLKDPAWFTGIKIGTKNTWNKLTDFLHNLDPMLAGIGVAPLIIWGVVVVATLIVGIATDEAVRQAIKPKADESANDFVESSTFKKACKNLTPKEQAALKTDINNQMKANFKKGFDDGVAKGEDSGILPSIIKPLAYGVMGFFAIKFGLDYLNNRKNKKQ